MSFKNFCTHLPLFVHWHIHSDEFFVGHSLWTFLAEAQRRVDTPQHIENLCVVDFATKKRIEALEGAIYIRERNSTF